MLFPELLMKPDPRANVVQDVSQLSFWRTLLLDRAARGLISADTEDDAFDPYNGGRAIGFSFGFDLDDGYGERGVYFPVRHRTHEAQLPIEPVIQVVREIFGNPAHRVVFQNFGFDGPFLRADGIEVGAYIDDTLIGGHLLDENESHRLEDMCVQYGIDPNAHEHQRVIKKAQTEEARVRRLKKGAMPGYAYIPVALLGPYAAKDAYNGLALAKKVLPRVYERYGELYATELVCARAFMDMSWEGVLVDVPYLLDLHKRTEVRLVKAIADVRRIIKSPTFDPQSDDDVRHLLYQHYRLPIYDKTDSGLPSVAAFCLKEIRRHHPEFSEFTEAMLEVRESDKIMSTYTTGIIKRTDKNGRVHSKFKQTGAKTGRISSVDPNLTNISSDDEDTATEADSIKQAFYVGPEEIRLTVDWSQIELRVFALRAKEPSMIKAFIDGEDIHLRNQIEVFGDHDKKSKKRRVVKVLAFGSLYGMSPMGIMQNLNDAADPKRGDAYCDEAQAEQWYNQFHRRYARIGAYTQELVALSRRRSPPSFDNLFGRTRRMPDLNDYRDWIVQSATRRLIASDIQGSAADLAKRTLARLWLRFKQAEKDGIYKAKLKNLIHDDLWADVDVAGAPQCAVDMKTIMENHPELNPVPVVADAEWIMPGKRWTDKVDVWPKK